MRLIVNTMKFSGGCAAIAISVGFVMIIFGRFGVVQKIRQAYRGFNGWIDVVTHDWNPLQKRGLTYIIGGVVFFCFMTVLSILIAIIMLF